MIRKSVLNVMIFLCLIAVCKTCYGESAEFQVIKKIKLGGEGGWDYPSIDSSARRLYLSRGTHVMVVDIDTEKLVGDIPDTPGVHGIAIVSDLNKGFISNGKGNNVSIFDLKTLKVLAQVKTGGNPDAILYDPASKKVFTFNGKSNDTTVIDAVTGNVLATLPLEGKPEFSACDGKGKVYVNIEDKSEVVEIDSNKMVINKRFSITPGEEPSGMGIDAKKHLIFSGCHNNMVTVLDAEAGKVIATVPIGKGVDGNGFDPETNLAFSANGEGTLTIIKESAPGKYEATPVVTVKGARTMAIDYKTHNIYLPTAEFEPLTGDQKRPNQVKDSFMVVVVGTK